MTPTLFTARAQARAVAAQAARLRAQIAKAARAYAAALKIYGAAFYAELAGTTSPALRWHRHVAAIGLWLIKARAVLAQLG